MSIMRNQYLYIICLILLVSCKKFSSSTNSFSGTQVIESEYEYENQDGFPDGTYSATVDYHNEETDYSATYTLEVEVEDNEVTIIYFPNGGYLDGDTIWSDKLDSDGYVFVSGEEGKSYFVQLDLDNNYYDDDFQYQ